MKFGKNGFSLMQVVVATGLVGAMSLAVMKILNSQSRSQKRLTQEFLLSTVSAEIQSILVRKSSCDETFEDEPLNGTVDTIIHKSVDDNVELRAISVNDPPLGDGISLGVIRLSNTYDIGPDSDGVVNVELHFNRREIGGNTSTVIKRVKIVVETDSLGRIDSCRGMLDGAQEESLTQKLRNMCESMGGTFDPLTSECNISNRISTSLSRMCTSMGGVFDATTGDCDIGLVMTTTACNVIGGRMSGSTCDTSGVSFGPPAPTPTPVPTAAPRARYQCPRVINTGLWGVCNSSCTGQIGFSSTCSYIQGIGATICQGGRVNRRCTRIN